jgi:hypothetical protein
MTVAENRIKALAALRSFPEERRYFGQALEKYYIFAENGELVPEEEAEEVAQAGKMCACAIIAQGLNIPLLVNHSTSFNYSAVTEALDYDVTAISCLNDQWNVIENKPLLTLGEIADKLGRTWQYGMAR